MKEETARTKWCPLTRIGETRNRMIGDNDRCKASDCMMWVDEEQTTAGYGHCGLAGRNSVPARRV